MKLLNQFKKMDTQKWCFFIIMLIAVLSRTIGLGKYPGGVSMDEAYAGYEAWSLLNYGTDSWGYTNPVYLNVWGSGMSVLNSVLMIPFVKILGLNTIATRIPQMLIGILSVYVFYLLLKKLRGTNTALLGMFLMAICPWHVMMSRWGLDCNLAPGFLLFGFYFFVLGLEKQKFLPMSALFWGLSLYCYATVWIVVPLLLLFFGIYCLVYKKIRFNSYTFVSVIILFLLALPLLLFVMVNMGWIPEIRGEWLSIPQLVDFRSDEVGKSNIVKNAVDLMRLIISQNDGLLWNSTAFFGMYYLFSMPLIFFGGFLFFKKMIAHLKAKEFGYELFILFWIAISLCLGILQGVNVNKMNYIHIPILILWTEGTAWICRKWKKKAGAVLVAVYLISFISFQGYYYTSYQEQISERQLAGADSALENALLMKEQGYDKISLPNVLRHPAVLFHTQWPLDNYLETVEWQEYPARWLKTKSFGDFVWRLDEETIDAFDANTVYVITLEEEKLFKDAGFKTELFDYCGIAYMEN